MPNMDATTQLIGAKVKKLLRSVGYVHPSGFASFRIIESAVFILKVDTFYLSSCSL